MLSSHEGGSSEEGTDHHDGDRGRPHGLGNR
jgi:hypothetical protein